MPIVRDLNDLVPLPTMVEKDGEAEDRGFVSPLARDRLLIISLIIFISSLVAMSLLGRSWALFRLIHSIWYLSYVSTIFLFVGSRLSRKLWSLGGLRSSILLFFLALVLHIPFMVQEPLLSQDIMRMSIRGEMILDGSVPYRDFDVNKPPLYIWMVGGISYIFGPSVTSFKVIFSLFNSLVPVLMLWIGRGAPVRSHRYTGRLPEITWKTASVAYLLWPVALLEVGLAGHFDPVVVVLSLIGFGMFLRRRYVLSGVFLGAGMALKIYPLFIVPAVVLAMERWPDRFKHLAALLAVPIIVSIPIMLVDPSLMFDYLFEQTSGWGSAMSVRYLLDAVSALLVISPLLPFITMSLAMLMGGVYLNMRGLRDLIAVPDNLPSLVLAGITSVMMIGYSLIILKSGADGISDWVMGSISLVISLFFLILSFVFFLGFRGERFPAWRVFEVKGILKRHTPVKHLPLIISGVLFLLILTSPQFHPWYLLWVMPFALTAHPSWSWFLITLFGVLQVNAYPPWELSSF
ncbi:MAG: hypothetical protein KAH57_09690 [Thermoplasmata archaeon]|nr:hypothetical protein [Thermoplasmata archaeon]